MKLLLNAATNKVCVSLHLLSGKQDRRNLSKALLLEGLILFMLEKYSDYDYLFWPDLAGGHYTIERISFLEDACMPVIRRDE